MRSTTFAWMTFCAIGLVALLAAAPAVAQPPAGAWVQMLDSVEWTEIVPGVDFGRVYGDWTQEAHGKLVRFAPGVISPLHTHGHPYTAVVIAGTVVNPYPGEENPPKMGPGDAWSTPAGMAHTTGCVSAEPCLVYAHMDTLWDIEIVAEPEGD